MRLDCRWYLAYDLHEKVPDHSSLSKIRDRFGLEIFQRFFEQIVDLCIEAGLVWGQELYIDGTKVQANAAIDGMIPRFYLDAQQHVQALFDANSADVENQSQSSEEQHPSPTARGFVDKYNGVRMLGFRQPHYERIADWQASPTDPDATPMRRFIGDLATLGYHTHYVVDGGKARVVLACLVTPASIMDNTPMLDLIRWSRFRWHLQPRIAVGDAKYGTVPNIVGLEQDGLRAYIPLPNQSRSHQFYSMEWFEYDPQRNLFICPQGQELALQSRSVNKQHDRYRADATICNTCPVKSACTKSRGGRTIHRSLFQDYLDRVKGYTQAWQYHKAMRKRQVWVEPKFAEIKQWHHGTRFRLRRLFKVNMEALLKAAGQNIKQLLKATTRQNKPRPPATIAALKLLPAIYPSGSLFEYLKPILSACSVMYCKVFFNGLDNCVYYSMKEW